MEAPKTVKVSSGSGRKRKTVKWTRITGVPEDCRSQSRHEPSIAGVETTLLQSFTELDMYVHLMPDQLKGLQEQCTALNNNLTPTQKTFDFGTFMVCKGINLMLTQIDGGIDEAFRVSMREEDILPAPAFGIRFGVSRDRFNLFRRRCKLTNWTAEDTDPWKPMTLYWKRFNAQRCTRINMGWKATYDELMQAWRGQCSAVHSHTSNPMSNFP